MRQVLENIYPDIVKSIETIKNTAFEPTKDFLEITRLARLETGLEEVIARVSRVFLSTIRVFLMIQEKIGEIIGLDIVGYEVVNICGDRYFIVELKGNASQVLEKWLEKIDELREISSRIGGRILLRWSGATDLSPDKIGEYLGKIFGKQEIFLKTPSRFNIVSILEKEWET